MIQPEEIRKKAENQYPAFQLAWLAGAEFFPKVIPCDKTLDPHLSVAIASIQQLRAGSKEVLGYGYSIQWEQRNSRQYGQNRFPQTIVIETPEDLLSLIGKQREFDRFTQAVGELRRRHPVLEPWIRSHRQELVDPAWDVDGLGQVLDYLIAHHRPGLFARELPLAVDTKFIERNRRVLRSLLDLVLPPHSIRADEEHFDRRYGLRYVEPLILVRFLDEQIQQSMASPWKDCAVPLHTLAAQPIAADRGLIVENKVNLLTLPRLPGTIALGGLGNGVTDLRYLPWLSNKVIWYWGDIDVDGYEILSRLRTIYPHVRSLLMDAETQRTFRTRIGATGNGRHPPEPLHLTPPELEAFRVCCRENLRIEQERVPQIDVLQALQGLTNDSIL